MLRVRLKTEAKEKREKRMTAVDERLQQNMSHEGRTKRPTEENRTHSPLILVSLIFYGSISFMLCSPAS